MPGARSQFRRRGNGVVAVAWSSAGPIASVSDSLRGRLSSHSLRLTVEFQPPKNRAVSKRSRRSRSRKASPVSVQRRLRSPYCSAAVHASFESVPEPICPRGCPTETSEAASSNRCYGEEIRPRSGPCRRRAPTQAVVATAMAAELKPPMPGAGSGPSARKKGAPTPSPK